MKTRTLDLFVTEEDFDKDEVEIGTAKNLATSGNLARVPVSTQPNLLLKLQEAAKKGRVIVRFLSELDVDNNALNYFTVVKINTGSFEVDRPVNLSIAEFKVMLVNKSLDPVLKLNTRFQHVVAAELLAYTLVGVSSQSHHVSDTQESAPMIDFVGLEIKEFPGRTMSTNRYMQNMFAVLTALPPSYRFADYAFSKDAMIFVPPGMMKVEYEEPINGVNTISPRLTDRKGQPVTAARFHMWLKLTVIDK